MKRHSSSEVLDLLAERDQLREALNFEIQEKVRAVSKAHTEIAVLTSERDTAMQFLRVLNEETVLAGLPGGDRTQTLANVRALRDQVRVLREAGQAFVTLREWVIAAGGCEGALPTDVIDQFRIMSESAHQNMRKALAQTDRDTLCDQVRLLREALTRIKHRSELTVDDNAIRELAHIRTESERALAQTEPKP